MIPTIGVRESLPEQQVGVPDDHLMAEEKDQA